MPQPKEIDRLISPLAQAYADAWESIEQQQQRLVDDPLRATKRKRLIEMQRSITRAMAELDEPTRAWTRSRLPQVYAAGGAIGATDAGATEFIWTQIHQEAAQRLAGKLYKDLLGATAHVNRTTKKLIRDVLHDKVLQQAIEGRTALDAARAMRNRLAESGIHAVRYSNGARHGLAEYSKMAMRTVSANAYNEGTINTGVQHGVTLWEVFDGPGCGWEWHGSPNQANGKIVTRDEALGYPISHPNCRRAFGGRPDLTQPKPEPEAKRAEISEDEPRTVITEGRTKSGDPLRIEIEHKGKVDIYGQTTRHEGLVKAYRGDKRVGRLKYRKNAGESHYVIDNLDTVEQFRRQGVASELLRAVRGEGFDVRHSTDLTPEGAAFAKATSIVQKTARQESAAFDIVRRGTAPITAVRRESLEFYVGPGYQDVNGYLRHDRPIALLNLQHVGRLERWIDESVLPADIEVYRSFGKDGLPVELNAGDFIQDRAFLSTSTSRQIAEGYLDATAPTLARIRVPRGTNAAAIDGLEISESEVLLQARSRLRVAGTRFEQTERYGRIRVVDLEVTIRGDNA